MKIVLYHYREQVTGYPPEDRIGSVTTGNWEVAKRLIRALYKSDRYKGYVVFDSHSTLTQPETPAYPANAKEGHGYSTRNE